MNDIMTMVKSFEEYILLIKDVSQTVKNEKKEKKRSFIVKLLGTLVPSLLVDTLKSKGRIRYGQYF